MPTATLSAAFEFDHHLALAHDRRLVLADLVALRQIRIEIVLAVEHRAQVDLCVEPEAGAHGLADAFLVDDGQHAGHRRIDQRDMAVRLAAEFCRGPRKQFCVRGDLGMDLQADHDFPVAGRALDQLAVAGGHVLLPSINAETIRSHSVSSESFATGCPACRYQ